VGRGRLRRALRRLLRPGTEDEPPRDPALVGLLAGSRFAGLPPEETDLTPQRARRVMDFILDLAEQMFAAGTDTRAIEVSVVAVAATYGVSPFEFTIAGRTVFVQHAPADREPQIMMKVARTDDSRDLYRAVKIYRMVEEVVHRDLDLPDAERRLRDIKRLQARWPWWAQLAGRAVLVSSITLQADGTPDGVLFAMGVLIVVNRTGWALARGGIPGYYATFVQASLVAGLGILALDLQVLSVRAYASATAANLVLLLPVPSIVSLAQDAITRFGTTAAVRLINAVLVFGALFAGIATIGFIAKDVRVIGNAQNVQFVALPLWLALLAAGIGAAAGAVAAGGAAWLLPFAAAMGMLSIAVRTLTRVHLGLPPSLAVLLAATVLGVVASRLAPRLFLPAGALVTPAIGASLLPGSDMYRALSAYTAGSSGAGRQLLSALIVTVAIGAGIVLGQILGVKKELREKQTPHEQ
jgi:uncharacterized membrane protein YjjP (DUF1212 family)